MAKFDIDDVEITTGCEAEHPDQRGGQHVGRPCFGVRVTYRPTGVSIMVNTERSRYANQTHALALLRAEVER